MTASPKSPEYAHFAKLKFTPFQRLRRSLQLWFVHGLMAVAAFLPVRASQWGGRMLAFALFPFLRRDRAICDYQFQLVFPELDAAARRKLAYRTIQNIGMTMMETLAIPRIRRNAEFWVKLEQRDVIEQAHAQGKGVIFVTGHMANWELLSVVFDMLRIPAQAVARSLANSRLDEVLLRSRQSQFLQIVLRGSRESPRRLLSCLKNGEALVLALDHDTRVPGVFVNFFGMPAHTARVAASLALRAGVPVVTGFGRRNPDGTHRFRFEAIPPPEGAVNDAEGVRRYTQLMSDAMEAHIRECPEQWSWNHRRWKTRPEESGVRG